MVFQTPVFATEETAVAVSSGVTTNGISGWPQGPEITSASAVIMEDTSDTILYAKDMDTTLSPAGAVKIMTCLLALENSQLDDQVTMTETGVSGVTDGGAHISSQLGEVFTMEQCLYALMLASANDIALQVAEQIGGSVDAFVQKMNDRAKELGCTNTVFTNPTGLPDDNQHTTAHDLALIMQAAIRNDSFRTISGATSYTIPATNVSGGTRNLTSSFTMTDPASASYYEGCIGGRESTTTASGSVLVTAAQRNGTTLIAVVMNGATGQTATEAISLLDYGFSNFQSSGSQRQDDHLQKVINTFLCMCRYRTEDCRTAPVLWYELVFHQLLLYTVDIRTFLINFIDCNNDLDASCFRMVDCLYGLWHNTIIGCNYKDCNIC